MGAKRFWLAVAMLAAVSGGCTSMTYRVPYVRAVTELAEAYPAYRMNAASESGPMASHPVYDPFYDKSLTVVHERVLAGEEFRANIRQESENFIRTTHISVRRLNEDDVQIRTWSRIEGKYLLLPSRDLTWEAAQMSFFGDRLERLEPPR